MGHGVSVWMDGLKPVENPALMKMGFYVVWERPWRRAKNDGVQ